MNATYIAELRSAPIEDLGEEELERFSDEIFEDRRLLGPAPSADLALHVLELRTAVEAASPAEAIDVAIAAFVRATKKVRLHGIDVVDVSVWLDDDSEHDRRELLSGADIAERLGITRQRIAQLVAEKGRFPRPAATFGSISVWRWGDVADWIAAGGRGSLNRLDAEAAAQVFSYARDDAQKCQAILRMIDLANDTDKSAMRFLDSITPAYAVFDLDLRRWEPGRVVSRYAANRAKATQTEELLELSNKPLARRKQSKSA